MLDRLKRAGRALMAAPETRAGGIGWWPEPTGWSALTGTAVSPMQAENLSAVTCAIQAIAGSIATLPAAVYRQVDGGRVEAPNHPVSRLIAEPNEWQTWPEFVEWLLAQTLLFGNGLAWIESDGAGRPVALHPMPWQFVVPQVLPSGRLAFDVAATESPSVPGVLPRRVFASDCLHLKDRSDNALLGRSRLARAPEVLRAGLGLQEFAAAIWQNAATPSSVVTLPPNITPEGKRRIEQFFNANHAGSRNAKRTIFADAGSTVTPVSVSPEDAQVLASRAFVVAEVARLFGVPPPLLQDYANNTFTNAGQADRWFATHSLMPWARKLEAAFAKSVFVSPGYSLEIDFGGLMRGSYVERWQANTAAVSAGILTPGEVREAEGYAPLAVVKAQGVQPGLAPTPKTIPASGGDDATV